MKNDPDTSKAGKGSPAKMAIVAIVALVLLYYIKISGFPLITEVAFAVGILVVSGMLIGIFGKIKVSFYGFNMVSTQKGVAFIDRLSRRHQKLWTNIADWGLVVGFGLLSPLMFRKQISKKVILLGIITNLFIFIVVYPALSQTISFINVSQITGTNSAVQTANQVQFNFFGFTLLGTILLFALIIGGFAAFIFIELAYFGLYAFFQIGVTIVSVVSGQANYSNLSGVQPGVAPLLPGIDIPFIGGILALVVTIAFHEFMHGVLGRIYKLRIKSVGAMLFGVVPIGAFVELDEKRTAKLKSSEQSRIFIAGIAGNILLTLFFFAIFELALTYVVPSIVHTSLVITAVIPNSPASHYLTAGMTILSWNNIPITNASSVSAISATERPLTDVNVTTPQGSYIIETNSTGKIGVGLALTTQVGPTQSDQILYILYTFIALAFLLNFLVGVLNLLPIPLFDGWRIYGLAIKNKLYLNILAVFIFLMLVGLALPWIWQH